MPQCLSNISKNIFLWPKSLRNYTISLTLTIKGGLRSHPLCRLAHQVLLRAKETLLSLRALHIHEVQNLGAECCEGRGWGLHHKKPPDSSRGDTIYNRPELWKLWAWPLRGINCWTKISQLKLFRPFWTLELPPLANVMPWSGDCSPYGEMKGLRTQLTAVGISSGYSSIPFFCRSCTF